jgi:hypothetical protein
MTEAQRAAFRLLAETPQERIHSHEWKPLVKEWGTKRTPAEDKVLKQKLLAMRKRGATNREMRSEYGCTNTTISKLIGPCRKKSR